MEHVPMTTWRPNPLQLLRLQAGLSQQDVGEAIGRSRETVSRIETGEYSLTPWVEELARLYGVTRGEVEDAWERSV